MQPGGQVFKTDLRRSGNRVCIPYDMATQQNTQTTMETTQKKVRVSVIVTEYYEYDYDFFCDDCREYFDIHDKKVIDDLWKRLLRRKEVRLGKVNDYELEDVHPMRTMIGELLETMMAKK